MAEKRLTTYDLKQLKTREEWAIYFSENDPHRTREDMAKDFNTTKGHLRNIYDILIKDNKELCNKYKLKPKKQGRPSQDKKFKGD